MPLTNFDTERHPFTRVRAKSTAPRRRRSREKNINGWFGDDHLYPRELNIRERSTPTTRVAKWDRGITKLRAAA